MNLLLYFYILPWCYYSELRSFLWPFVPWLAWPVASVFLRQGLAGIFNSSLVLVLPSGVLCHPPGHAAVTCMDGHRVEGAGFTPHSAGSRHVCAYDRSVVVVCQVSGHGRASCAAPGSLLRPSRDCAELRVITWDSWRMWSSS